VQRSLTWFERSFNLRQRFWGEQHVQTIVEYDCARPTWHATGDPR